MKKISKLKKKIILVLSLFIFIIIILNAITIYESRKVYQTEELPMFVQVSNYTGFNVDTGAIYFGTIPTSGKGARLVHIVNSDKDSKVILTAIGDIAEWVLLPEEPITLKPRETIEIPIIINIPQDASSGYFSGKLKIKFLKA